MIGCRDWEPCRVQSCTTAALVLHAPPTRQTRDEVLQVLETGAEVQSGAALTAGHSLSLCSRGRPWGVLSWALHSDTPAFTLQEPCTALGARVRPCSPSCWPWVWGTWGARLWVWGQQPHVTTVWGRPLSPVWDLSSLELPPPQRPAGPVVPGSGGEEGPLLFVGPAFCLEKNFNLKENLQGGPREHHLLFTLKFQNMQNIGKLLTSASFPHPSPSPRNFTDQFES